MYQAYLKNSTGELGYTLRLEQEAKIKELEETIEQLKRQIK